VSVHVVDVVLLLVFCVLSLRLIMFLGMVLLFCLHSSFLGKVKWCNFYEYQN
jgi:hypothetical protein